MTDHPGHLFVAHGRLEAVHADAVIVPTGREFHFPEYWDGVVGPEARQPERWEREGWGRLHGSKVRAWGVSVGGSRADGYDVILGRIDQALASIGKRRDAHSRKRGEGTLPLVAVPVIGIGRGGHGRDRGSVMRKLVDHLAQAVQTHRVDIVLMSPDPAVYAAAQYARHRFTTLLPEGLDSRAREIGRRARNGELALFLGAGVGVPAGLPTWQDLIGKLAAEFGVRDMAPGDSELTVTDKAELIELTAKEKFQDRIADLVGEHAIPSLLHTLVAGLDCREVVTTNYDLLYEAAVHATGRPITSVLPWTSAQGAKRWILKLHGDVKHPGKIVLTRRHMVMYDALNRPSGAILQSLLLTKHLLVVGASMSDDNVVRLAHEVQSYRGEHKMAEAGPFGTVLDVGGDRVRRRLWKGQLDWLLLPDAGVGSGPRAGELFLDRIAFHAARDSSWLLDQRFEGLLDSDRDRTIAAKVRDLYRDLPDRDGTKWTPLARVLRDLGVDSSG